MLNVKIDSREKGRRFRASSFYNDKGHTTSIEMLDVGDYLFNDRVVFEYKDVGDFMSSIMNDSVFNEAANQSLEYPFHYVVVVGDVMNFLSNNWYRVRGKYGNDYHKYLVVNLGRYSGALRRLRTFTTPIECKNEDLAFNEMLLQSIKCLDGKSKFYSNVTRQVESQDPVDVLLTSAKGVSIKKAEAIRKTHNLSNVYDLMNLTINDLQEVEGIGPKVSSNVYEFIHKGEDKQ